MNLRKHRRDAEMRTTVLAICRTFPQLQPTSKVSNGTLQVKMLLVHGLLSAGRWNANPFPSCAPFLFVFLHILIHPLSFPSSLSKTTWVGKYKNVPSHAPVHLGPGPSQCQTPGVKTISSTLMTVVDFSSEWIVPD